MKFRIEIKELEKKLHDINIKFSYPFVFDGLFKKN